MIEITLTKSKVKGAFIKAGTFIRQNTACRIIHLFAILVQIYSDQPIATCYEDDITISSDYMFVFAFQEPFDWGQVDRGALSMCLLALCRQVKDVLKEEPRLIRLKSPTYILGMF